MTALTAGAASAGDAGTAALLRRHCHRGRDAARHNRVSARPHQRERHRERDHRDRSRAGRCRGGSRHTQHMRHRPSNAEALGHRGQSTPTPGRERNPPQQSARRSRRGGPRGHEPKARDPHARRQQGGPRTRPPSGPCQSGPTSRGKAAPGRTQALRRRTTRRRRGRVEPTGAEIREAVPDLKCPGRHARRERGALRHHLVDPVDGLAHGTTTRLNRGAHPQKKMNYPAKTTPKRWRVQSTAARGERIDHRARQTPETTGSPDEGGTQGERRERLRRARQPDRNATERDTQNAAGDETEDHRRDKADLRRRERSAKGPPQQAKARGTQ